MSTTRTLLLALHITGVAAWLGANFVQLVLTPRFAKEDRAVTKAWTDATIMLGMRYYNLAGALIAVTGVLLVLDGDWSWSAGFVWVGITVVVIGGAMGGLVFAPQSKRRSEALSSGDDAAAAATLRTIIPAAVLDTALILTAVVAMVHKWQA
jgi:hypothetical protein